MGISWSFINSGYNGYNRGNTVDGGKAEANGQQEGVSGSNNSNNNTSTKFDSLLETVNRQILSISTEVSNLYFQQNSTSAPKQPSNSDTKYYNNGVFNKEKYNEDLDKYQQKQNEYKKHVNDIKNKIEMLRKQLSELNDIKKQLEKAKSEKSTMSDKDIDAFEKKVDSVINGKTVKEAGNSETDLNSKIQTINKERLDLANKLNKLQLQLAELDVPTPPTKMDPKYYDNCVFNQEKYNEDFGKYQNAMVQYQNASSAIQQQIDNLKAQDKELEDLLTKYEAKNNGNTGTEDIETVKKIINDNVTNALNIFRN